MRPRLRHRGHRPGRVGAVDRPAPCGKADGIGCSSKTPTYFLRDAHGFNCAHGRMPAIATGANAANSDLTFIGISGDGDSLSIGLGQLSHAIRRNVKLIYLLENNGVYGLTKGQFSASADIGSTSKNGEPNRWSPSTACVSALTLGATFVARSFSGDKEQLVPILKAAVSTSGFALVDVISPCVTFNDHAGSTKSYAYTREHNVEIVAADFVMPTAAITTDYASGTLRKVMMHDGSWVTLRKLAEDYDPTDRDRSYQFIREAQGKGEVVTGLLGTSPRIPGHARTGRHRVRRVDADAVPAAVSGRRRAAGPAAAVQVGEAWQPTCTHRTCRGCFERIAGRRVLVVGDVILDEYIDGDAARISPEAPVPVLRFTSQRSVLGGAANTAANVASLGGQATLVGAIAADSAGAEVMRQCAAAGMRSRGHRRRAADDPQGPHHQPPAAVAAHRLRGE